jgi:hypothetical protein
VPFVGTGSHGHGCCDRGPFPSSHAEKKPVIGKSLTVVTPLRLTGAEARIVFPVGVARLKPCPGMVQCREV